MARCLFSEGGGFKASRELMALSRVELCQSDTDRRSMNRGPLPRRSVGFVAAPGDGPDSTKPRRAGLKRLSNLEHSPLAGYLSPQGRYRLRRFAPEKKPCNRSSWTESC